MDAAVRKLLWPLSLIVICASRTLWTTELGRKKHNWRYFILFVYLFAEKIA